ncbi:MAG: sigma-70 family RNA polymerase sigma factor [Muribaculaceae bacterium]|nr:sigma-70 family RNA polymerase sigma factor [Muribaculaceae bacterium]MBR6489116.1 sigma-70 family RNA polymerase sigma factor [Muribaculaceae bacterium]
MRLDLMTSSFLELREKLHNIAMHYLQSDVDAQDALQDTWLKLSDKGDVETSQEARNKLVVVLRNICIDQLRKKRSVPIDSINSSDVPQCCMEIENIERLEQLLQQQLTPHQRQIFNLVTHEGCDYERIAEKMSMSVEAVRMNMSRIRKKIRETYKKLNQ